MPAQTYRSSEQRPGTRSAPLLLVLGGLLGITPLRPAMAEPPRLGPQAAAVLSASATGPAPPTPPSSARPAVAPAPPAEVRPPAVPTAPSPATPFPSLAPASSPPPATPADPNVPLGAGVKGVSVGSSLGSVEAVARRGNLRVLSFAHAKSYLRVLYDERPRTLYSDCPYDRARQIDYTQCRFRPRFAGKRAHRVEWEHVVPAQAFGQTFAAWRRGHPNCVDTDGRPFRGRRCAQRASAAYRLMEADLYNLYPEIGELNQLRSNKPMGEPRRKRRELMPPSATFVGSDAFAPRPAVRGDVARTYRYMHDAYPGRSLLSREREAELSSWEEADPVDAWECRRAWRIEALQGNVNRFVRAPCLEAGLWPSG